MSPLHTHAHTFLSHFIFSVPVDTTSHLHLKWNPKDFRLCSAWWLCDSSKHLVKHNTENHLSLFCCCYCSIVFTLEVHCSNPLSSRSHSQTASKTIFGLSAQQHKIVSLTCFPQPASSLSPCLHPPSTLLSPTSILDYIRLQSHAHPALFFLDLINFLSLFGGQRVPPEPHHLFRLSVKSTWLTSVQKDCL